MADVVDGKLAQTAPGSNGAARTQPRAATAPAADFVAPHPGSKAMPPWNTGELIDAPRFTWSRWFAMLGPGLLMAGAAIGGGEWLMGPAVTARFGPGLMWLATISIIGQVFYNLEISRYTLYTGEPIFTGKFRTLPGPMFWLGTYLLLDFGSVFPYLAANAATPVATAILGHLPNPEASFTLPAILGGATINETSLITGLGIAIFVTCLIPLIAGGKIYNSLKLIMTFKIITVFGFLIFMAISFSRPETWAAIGRGFVSFGNVPVAEGELRNIFSILWNGEELPVITAETIGLLVAFTAIAGQGGLSNAPLSNFTRDQGWGMGYHVGAIPSVFGGRNIALSHVGMVFKVDEQSLPRWRRWYRHVMRDQLAVWMPACFIGIALPSILSLEFLPRGTTANDWTAAAMTADGVKQNVAASWGNTWGLTFWYLTLLCGFLVLTPTAASTVDGIVRRWVDVFWTSSPRLRKWDSRHIRNLYFYVLISYSVFGIFMLYVGKPLSLLVVASNLMNLALGVSCLHALAINVTLLPRELRPNWFMRIGLAATGVFFISLAYIQFRISYWDAIVEAVRNLL